MESIPETHVPKEAWFSRGEYERRLAAVRRAMAESELDAFILFSAANTYYLTGHHSVDSWEFRAVVVTPDRNPVVLLYSFERGRFMASSWLEEAHYYEAGDDPVAALARIVADAGLRGRRLGIEASCPTVSAVLLERVEQALAGARIERVDRLVDRIRCRKSSEELACIHRAAELTRLGMKAAMEAVSIGVRDHEIAAAATSAMIRAGSHNLVMMPTVAVGHRSGLAHSEHDGVAVQSGDAVFIELSGCWRHYSAPLMGTITMGPVDDLRTELLQTAHRVADVILQESKPGVRACDVADAAREAMRPIEKRIQFHYNFGYSVGVNFPPHWLEESAFYLKTNNPAPLEVGMVFHAPLTMRILGRLAVGTSRTFEITPTGARALTGDPNRIEDGLSHDP